MPDLLLVAGPNGSGKSTIFPAIQKIKRFDWSDEPVKIPTKNFVNPDNIARKGRLSEIAAGKEALRQVQSHIESLNDFAIETTMAGSTYLKYLDLAIGKGYRIYIAFVFLDSAELSMIRVTQRALLGKHYIPLSRILERYQKSLRNFFENYSKRAFFWVAIDNSALEVKPVCWGGSTYMDTNVYVNKVADFDSLSKILQTNSIAFPQGDGKLSVEDKLSKLIFEKIRKAVFEEVRKRPSENYVAISSSNGVRFVKPKKNNEYEN